MTQLSSEQDFLTLIDKYFPSENGHITLGRGDDCSILRTDKELCISKDLFLEDIHFRRSYFSAADIGYKSLAVNISDIAAMGGRPKGFELGLIIPPSLGIDFWEPFFQAMSDLAKTNNIILAGGDLSKGQYLGISITVWGEPAENGIFLSRGNAKIGDILFLHGQAGMARTGLLALEELGPQAAKLYPESVKAHLRPTMRVKEGLKLAASSHVRGLMDLSDGLARDLPRFLNCCTGSLGAEISLPESSLHPEIIHYAKSKSASACDHAYLGGEDYALFGAVSAKGFKELTSSIPDLKAIGKITAGSKIYLNGAIYAADGFDHFSK
ncbi:thiamine-phosphate kinase [Maridesulfovibrio hydrothermalis]|uniref:Thiamine-monophosphate kinase n=1 Tax=Maridesulfovibrio hydrothermalis AM13 = DSM 14728 TaxID=1121451 RepID=L0RDH5_9BACT|nr:thiamine-phosphate kinase [Maridesulfovibrio hydrothermalis]CCO24799.1 Thiamine-monophosphate kinase [Maridesulfovibrio hydrothermalis AM13 = DSM 14728]